MPTRTKQGPIAAAALGVLLTLGGLRPTQAASITAEAFVAVVQPTIGFVAAAGRLALETSTSQRIRDVARTQIRDQAAAGTALVPWRQAEIRAEAAAATAPTIDRLAPLARVVTIPFGAVTDLNRAVGSPFAPLDSAQDMQIAAQAELARLAARRGAEFDSDYLASQRSALLRLSDAYKDFILNGDDVTLRRIAVDNLPIVQRRIGDLRRAGS